MKILLETSARHIHLSKQDLETLFGAGAKLNHRKDLSQPGEYVCEEKVDIVGPKRTLAGVSVVGPCRKESQVEVALTDARTLGIDVPVRQSGALEGSQGCTLVGPAGKVELKEGLIAAQRHIHATPCDAAEMGIKDKDVVCIKVDGTGRSGILCDFFVRVHPNFKTLAHIDTDEANALGIRGEAYGEVVAACNKCSF